MANMLNIALMAFKEAKFYDELLNFVVATSVDNPRMLMLMEQRLLDWEAKLSSPVDDLEVLAFNAYRNMVIELRMVIEREARERNLT